MGNVGEARFLPPGNSMATRRCDYVGDRQAELKDQLQSDHFPSIEDRCSSECRQSEAVRTARLLNFQWGEVRNFSSRNTL